MLPSKFEANPIIHLEQDVHLFLASSCSNDYFQAYAIIYFLANRLVFQNMVTYMNLYSANFYC